MKRPSTHSIRSLGPAAAASAILCTLSVNAWAQAPAPKPAAAQPAPKPAAAEPAPNKDEVAALRSEAKSLREDVQALREELKRAVGASALAQNQERAKLETELEQARKKRASIQAAIDAGLDRKAVADSITNLENRIAELEAALAKQSEGPKTRSLAEVSDDVRRLDAALAQQQGAPAAEKPAESPEKSSDKPSDKDKGKDAPSQVTVAKTGFFQPSANLQVWAYASHLKVDATPDESWTSSLRIRRAEFRIKGEIIPKTFGYLAMFDAARLLDFSNKTVTVAGEMPAPETAGTVTVAQPPTGGATSILQDVALTYMNDYADVSIGQFKIPVSLEGAGSASKLLFPERSLVARKYGDRRDIGVKAEKKFEQFGYTLGLYNGEGQNKLDSNDQKDLTLRLEAYPIKELTLAVVGYTAIAERDEVGTKDRVEGDVKLEKNGVLLQAEYIHAWDMAGTAAKHKRIEGHGFYVVAGYTFFEKLQPLVRIGSLDPEIGEDEHGAKAVDSNDETNSYELGVNYYFKSHDAKMQLAGGYFDPEQRSQHPRFDLTLAAQIAF